MNRIEGMVERRIREAQDRGLFDNLPGAGRPLGDFGDPREENWWLRQYLLREGVSGVPFLPPALALRKEAEDLPRAVAAQPTEAQVRAIVTALNGRIRDALAKPAEGPPMTLMPVDVDQVVLNWRLTRIASRAQVGATEGAGEIDQASGGKPVERLPGRWRPRLRMRRR